MQKIVKNKNNLLITCLNKNSYNIEGFKSNDYDFYYNTLNNKSNDCSNTYCPMDICSDGEGRRQISNECCQCPSSRHLIAQYKNNNNKNFSESYFYGNVEAAVDKDAPLPSILDNLDTVVYFSGTINLNKNKIPYPDSNKIINGGTFIFCIGGGETVWGNNSEECYGYKKEDSPNYCAHYHKFDSIIEEIYNKGWKGIMLDWERIDKSHRNEDLIYLLKQIKTIGKKYINDPIVILHTASQGPFKVDPSYNNEINENKVIMTQDIYKHIDYLSILLFNNDPPLLNYTNSTLDETLTLWKNITDINNINKVFDGIKIPNWGDGGIGAQWHYFPESETKLLFFLSCFKNGLQPWPNPPKVGEDEESWEVPTICYKPTNTINKIKNSNWKGIHYWIYPATQVEMLQGTNNLYQRLLP